MTRIRVGTRGSELALWQADWVSDRLREALPGVEVERVIIKTLGDADQNRGFGSSWPVGAFVSALEAALANDEVDLAVHSLKDLQTAPTEGLVVAATPERGPVHDVLLTRRPLRLEDLPDGARIGTSSPRRAAQIRELGDFEIVPIRGNVPTRIAKLEEEDLDGVVLAAAGVLRLGIEHSHTVELPVESFLPAPGQGALAVQARLGSSAHRTVVALDDGPTRTAVTAERSLLREIGAGCHAPVGALGTVSGETVSLHGKLFSDGNMRMVEGTEVGLDPADVGIRLARRLLADLAD